MLERLLKINRMMRKAVLAVGGLIVLFKLIEKSGGEDGDYREGFQTEEFDDIW